jgi:hypothetical protein
MAKRDIRTLVRARRSNIHAVPFSFNHLPVATQVMFKRIRQSVDNFCRIDCRSGVISYTQKHKPNEVMTLDAAECQRIFDDLYGDEQ